MFLWFDQRFNPLGLQLFFSPTKYTEKGETLQTSD